VILIEKIILDNCLAKTQKLKKLDIPELII